MTGELVPSMGEILSQTALVATAAKMQSLSSAISTPEEYRKVVATLQEVKHNLKKLDEFEEKEKRPHLDDLAEIRERYKPLRDSFKGAETALKKSITDYDAKLDRERLEAQRKANEAAEKERAKLLKKAERARAKGQEDRADELDVQAAAVVAPVVRSEPPKVEGTHFVDHWCFEVFNAADVPEEYKVVDMRKLQKVVSALKAQCRIPGVRVWFEKRVSSESREPEQL